ncbi:hypothetical protein Hanom_Chr14g01255631 [Helianthus anomalus]
MVVVNMVVVAVEMVLVVAVEGWWGYDNHIANLIGVSIMVVMVCSGRDDHGVGWVVVWS